MIATLCGYREVSFTNQQTGQLVNGVKFYWYAASGLRGLTGFETFDCFLSEDSVRRLGIRLSEDILQSDYELLYNRYGKVDSIKSVYTSR